MIDLLDALFSLFCGQTPHRSFRLGGEVLPVCQRCLGVYCGLLVGAVSVPRAFRREAVRPGWAGSILIGGAIAAMVVMGFHLIDPGPMARFGGGCLFGAALAWLGVFSVKSTLLPARPRIATGRETARFWLVVFAGAAALGCGLGIDHRATHVVFSVLALAGWLTASGLVTALVYALGGSLVRYALAIAWGRQRET